VDEVNVKPGTRTGASRKTDDVYKVSRIVKGKVEATGVGMEVENGLAVGWRRAAS
jgi:hypothetical protein